MNTLFFALCCCRVLKFFLSLLYGTNKLVGAAGVFVSAADAAKLGLYVFNVHASNKRADALKVAVAPASKLHIAKDAVFVYLYFDQTAARAAGGV